MQILFDAFKYTDEYYAKIEAGILTHEDDCNLEVDCYKEKILIETDDVSSAAPTDKGKYTRITVNEHAYLINVPFNDYCKVIPHIQYAYLKSRWAN